MKTRFHNSTFFFEHSRQKLKFIEDATLGITLKNEIVLHFFGASFFYYFDVSDKVCWHQSYTISLHYEKGLDSYPTFLGISFIIYEIEKVSGRLDSVFP